MYSVGDRIKFEEERQSYKIMAANERFLICVKPFNARKTYLYTIVDLKEKIRGADNYHCRYDYEFHAQDALNQLMEDLNKVKTSKIHYVDAFGISDGSQIKLKIEKVIPQNKRVK